LPPNKLRKNWVTELWQFLLDGVAALLLVPVLVLLAETLPGPAQGAVRDGERRRRLAILIPAHNEALLIAATVRSVLPQLESADRLVVVADNCSDDTAAIAAREGAEAIVRIETARRGKGYALDFGIRHLERDPPEIVVIIDADCQVREGSIDRLACDCSRTGRPVQALYLMRAPRGAGLKARIAEFAWIVRNQARPMGLHRLGLPCQLMGTGMAFPWAVIRSANLATGHIVEDLKLGLDLARSATAPLFCPEALVSSDFPASDEGVRGQRERWEHGHLGTIVSEAPRLLWHGLTRLDGNSLALALDLSVPPLALLVLLVAAVWLVSAVSGAWRAFAMASIGAALLATAVLLSWARYARGVISLRNLAFAAVYALWKIPLYARFLIARRLDWVRAKRDP
jgi:cellulose synthase/poly-beta-1,6-N-acetylglucosamine synthase-like glycosyltransferase